MLVVFVELRNRHQVTLLSVGKVRTGDDRQDLAPAYRLAQLDGDAPDDSAQERHDRSFAIGVRLYDPGTLLTGHLSGGTLSYSLNLDARASHLLRWKSDGWLGRAAGASFTRGLVHRDCSWV